MFQYIWLTNRNDFKMTVCSIFISYLLTSLCFSTLSLTIQPTAYSSTTFSEQFENNETFSSPGQVVNISTILEKSASPVDMNALPEQSVSQIDMNTPTEKTSTSEDISTPAEQTTISPEEKNTPPEQTATYEDYVNLLNILTGFSSRVRPVVNQSEAVTVYVDFNIDTLLAVHESTQTIGEWVAH